MKPLRIILDAGHGGSDPGCVYPGEKITERDQNLALVLSMKAALVAQGILPILSRSGVNQPGQADPHAGPSAATWKARTSALGACDLYAAVHFDVFNAGRKRGGVFYSADPIQRPGSAGFAQALVNTAGGWLEPDTSSNHGRLYIRDARTQRAVLWEVGPLKELSREERIEKADVFTRAVCAYFNLPYVEKKL